MSVLHFYSSFIYPPTLAGFHVRNKNSDPGRIYRNIIFFQINLPCDWIFQWNLIKLLYTIATGRLKIRWKKQNMLPQDVLTR